MSRSIRYLSHPQVEIDPNRPTPRWPLNDRGVERARVFSGAACLAETVAIYSSGETKALETAALIAAHRGLPIFVDEAMGEIDRSSTGFLPSEAFEAQADAFFARPADSVEGWERAMDAQARICAAFERASKAHPTGDLLLVGHGAVGTLLYCAKAGLEIARRFDQPPGQGGHVLRFSGSEVDHWRKLEDFYP